MKVIVERCIRGKDDGNWNYRLTFRCHRGDSIHRESIIAPDWTRRQSSEALDILEYLYGVDRKAVRFVHK